LLVQFLGRCWCVCLLYADSCMSPLQILACVIIASVTGNSLGLLCGQFGSLRKPQAPIARTERDRHIHIYIYINIYIYIYIYLNAARIPPGQNWVWWVLSTRDMFRCSLQRRFLTKLSGSVVVSAPARTRIEALLRSLGWPWDPGGVLSCHWEIPWRPWRSFGAILEVSEGSGVNPVKVEWVKIVDIYDVFW